MKSSTVIGGTSEKHDRHESDFYPTPKECTYALVDFLNSDLQTCIPFNMKIWECACGDEAIMDALLEKGYNEQVGTDINMGVDFLTAEKRAEVVITNPPFNLAADFIKRSISLDLQMFAMLLKGSYWHSKNRLPLFNLQKPSYILPLTWRPVFVETRGTSPTMEFMWCVWFKGDETTKYVPLQKPSISTQRPLFKT